MAVTSGESEMRKLMVITMAELIVVYLAVVIIAMVGLKMF